MILADAKDGTSPSPFNVIAGAPDRESAISIAIAELEAAGYQNVVVVRSGKLAESAIQNASGVLLEAINTAVDQGVGIVRYTG